MEDITIMAILTIMAAMVYMLLTEEIPKLSPDIPEDEKQDTEA